MYNDKPIREYLDDLAARKPAPGGGSAAALSAAIGASLMSMVANYTLGNPKYAASEARAADILKKSEKCRAELQELVDKDAEAYEKLSAGIKSLGKNSSGLDSLYKAALKVPFQICMVASYMLGLCKDLAECGNKNLITDTAIAAILIEGAFFSAKYNVYVNLKCVKDIDYVGDIHKMLSPLEESIPKLKEEILEMCEDVIAK